MRCSLAVLCLIACHAEPPPAVPERLQSPKARAADHYIDGYNSLVTATAKHLIEAHSTAVSLADMGHLMPRFGVQHELMKAPLRQARQAFDEAKQTDETLAASAGVQADALFAAAEALTESYRHLSDYYDRAGFQVDDGAQKDSLAIDFDKKEEAYRAARIALNQTIGRCNDELALEELKQFEAAKSYGYWLRRADIDAKQLSRAAASADPAAYKKARATFDETTSGIRAFAAAHPGGARTFGKLVTAIGAMNVAAARLEAVMGKKKELVDAEVLNLDHAYNDVAKLAARLYDMETNGGLE